MMRLRSVPFLSAAALAAALSLSPVSLTSARAEPPVPQIAVTGEGRVDAAPDMATITLGVTTVADTAAAAMAQNADQVAAVLANLSAAGIEPRDVQTSGLSLNPNWSNYDGSSQPTIQGYTAQNMVTVRVRALAGLGTVLDAAVKDGANTLNGLSFGLADPKPLEDTARTRAVEDARRKAEILAKAAGVTLGPVLSITEGGGYAPPQPMFRMEASASDSGVPVAGGEVGVAVSVSVVWALAK